MYVTEKIFELVKGIVKTRCCTMMKKSGSLLFFSSYYQQMRSLNTNQQIEVFDCQKRNGRSKTIFRSSYSKKSCSIC